MGKTKIQLHEDRRAEAKVIFERSIQQMFSGIEIALSRVEKQLNESDAGVEVVKEDLESLQEMMREYGIYHALYGIIDKHHDTIVERIKNVLSRISCQQIGGYRYATTKGRENVDKEKVELAFNSIKGIVEHISTLSKEDIVSRLQNIISEGYMKMSAPSKMLTEVSEVFAVFDI